MQRLLIIISLLYSSLVLAKPGYQIDLIIFAQPTATQDSESHGDIPLIPMSSNAINLKPSTGKIEKPYSLLTSSSSSLKDQYYLLSRRSNYPVLGHFSWKQPANNQSTVALPLVEHGGWQLQGTLRVVETNYYTFKADLQVSPPNNPQSSFTVLQKQRLKDNIVYYLDNDHLGILVKIHKIT